jgi:hypothetical protein
MHDRTDYVVRMPLDLKAIAPEPKEAITPESLRVLEVDAEKRTMVETPSVFKKCIGYAAGIKEQGTLIWQIKGQFPGMSQRSYQVYFDTGAKPAPTYPAIPGADEDIGINLVPNSSFEDVDKDGKPVNWQQAYSSDAPVKGSVEVTDKEAHTGKRSLHISKPTAEGNAYFYCQGSWVPVPPIPIKAQPGKKYQLSGWSKTVGKAVSFQFGFADDKWNAQTQYQYQTGVDSPRGTHDWVQSKCVLLSPPGTAYAWIRLHGGKEAGEAYFDDIEIIQLPDVEPAKITVGKFEKR